MSLNMHLPYTDFRPLFVLRIGYPSIFLLPNTAFLLQILALFHFCRTAITLPKETLFCRYWLARIFQYCPMHHIGLSYWPLCLFPP